MNKVSMNLLLALCLLFLAGLFTHSMAAEEKISKGPDRVLMPKKADLIVEKITTQKIDQKPKLIPPGAHVKVSYKVKISVTVKNAAFGPRAGSTAASLTPEGRARHCAGASKLLLQWTKDPTTGTFNYLGEAGIPPLNPGESKTVFFTQWVRKGEIRKYIATADHLNWINEWNEMNNVKNAGYIAR